MPADDDDSRLPFTLPTIRGKKVTAAFDGGTVSSDGGVSLLAGADKRLGLIDALARLFLDALDPAQVTLLVADMLRERIFAIACGYDPRITAVQEVSYYQPRQSLEFVQAQIEQSRTLDEFSAILRSGALSPEHRRALSRLSRGLVYLWCQSHAVAPKSIILDIDDTADTADTVHGHQQLSLFNAHYDERCFLPIHICDAASGHCVLTLLRPGKTPDGKEIRAHLRRLVRRIRLNWPNTRITFRGDGHHGRKEAMEWCNRNGRHLYLRPGVQQDPGGTGVSEARRVLRPPRACSGGESARLRLDALRREVLVTRQPSRSADRGDAERR
jgi:hypothetical protein